MKYFLTFLAVLFLLLPLIGSCQTGVLGQSKQYIINQHNECYIVKNTDTYLEIHCFDIPFFYFFNEDTHLCNKTGMKLPMSEFDWYITKLRKQGFTLSLTPEEYSIEANLMHIYCTDGVICAIYSSKGNYFISSFNEATNCR